MMSTRSPAISLDTACTREPRMPTQAPTGSMRGSLLRTAILARTPGSRAAPRIWMRPCPTSGTSSLKSSIRNSGAARFSLGIEVERVLEPQLVLGHLELLGVVGEHLPAPEGLVVAALAVDGDAHVPLLAVFLAGRGRERGFERLEDHFLVDALLVGDGVHHHQDFLVHCAAYLSNTRFARQDASRAAGAAARAAGTRAAAAPPRPPPSPAAPPDPVPQTNDGPPGPPNDTPPRGGLSVMSYPRGRRAL